MNTLRTSIITLMLLGSMTIDIIAQDSVPTMINYQGYLTDQNGTPLQGDKTIIFSLYPDTLLTSNNDWSEQQSVYVEQGLYNVLLGISTPLTADIVSGVKFLGIRILPDPEMEQRMRLVSVPYSLRTEEANYAHNLSAPDNDPLEAVIVTNNGNVGVGESSPQAKLDVNGSMKVSGKFDFADTFGWTSKDGVAWVINERREVIAVDETDNSGILLMVHATGGARNVNNYVKIWIDGELWRTYLGNVESVGPTGWLGSDDSGDANTGVLTIMPFKTFQESLKVALYNYDTGAESFIRVSYLVQ